MEPLRILGEPAVIALPLEESSDARWWLEGLGEVPWAERIEIDGEPWSRLELEADPLYDGRRLEVALLDEEGWGETRSWQVEVSALNL